MCGNCRYAILCERKIICMKEESDDYGKVVSKVYVCDNFEPDYKIGDTVRHFYTKDILEISDFGTGCGKVSIGCVNATKSEWELISNNKNK